jgi:hypothetical protein
MEYTKMSAVALKKLLDERKIEGRSKITKKDAMIKVLELFDQNPDDKLSITALISENSTPRKKTTKSAETDAPVSEEGETPVKKTKSKKVTSDAPVSEEGETPVKKTKSKKVTSDAPVSDEGETPVKKTKSKKVTSDAPVSEEGETPVKKTKSKKVTSDAPVSEEGETPVKKTTKTKKTTDIPKISEDDEPLKKTKSKKMTTERQESGEESAVEKPKRKNISKKLENKSEQESTPTPRIVVEEETPIKEGKMEMEEETPIKEGKMEIEESEKNPSQRPLEKDEVVDVDDNPEMEEVVALTRDILKQMNTLTMESLENSDFKNTWIQNLNMIRSQLDKEIQLLKK